MVKIIITIIIIKNAVKNIGGLSGEYIFFKVIIKIIAAIIVHTFIDIDFLLTNRD